MTKYVPLLNQIKRKIDNAKVVSFDIFDTLLFRPYARPTDLFLHIELTAPIPGFSYQRTRTERETRKKIGREDITLDEIYEDIHDVFKPFKQAELDWEEMVLTQNPEMKAVWDYAKKAGKTIVVTSDMYLPSAFLSKVLKKQGFTGFKKLYVSGELGKTKACGTLFRHIIDDLGVAPGDILHIGDNECADYKNPRKYGIVAVKYKQLLTRFLETNKFAKEFFDKSNQRLAAGIIVSMFAMRWQKQMLGLVPNDNYWEHLGYTLAGPVGYGFMRWVKNEVEANSINNLMFVARDGYTLQKIFDTFDSDIKTSYVYAPRFLNLIARLDFDVNHLVKEYRRQICSIVNYFQKDKVYTDPMEAYEYYKDHEKEIKTEATKINNAFKKYLNGFVSGKKDNIAMVDTITGLFSSQKLIEDTLNKPILGLYFVVLRSAYAVHTHKMFRPNTDSELSGDDLLTKNWDLMEFLFTAPEFPVKGITLDGKPIHSAGNEYEQIRKDVYPHISRGALEFANDIKRMFNNNDIFMTSEECVKIVNSFCDNPTKQDKKMMSQIFYSGDADHKYYEPLFICKVPLSQTLLHPKSLNKFHCPNWLSPFQKTMVVMTSPIKINMRGLKYIHITMFKKMPWQLVNINLFDRYRLIIGKNNKD